MAANKTYICVSKLKYTVTKLTWLAIAIITLGLFSCSNHAEKQFSYEITKHIYYPNLSSASGITTIQDKLVLVGDDLPWLVELNPNFSTGMYTQISGIDSVVDGRTPYQMKADYECMESFSDDGLTKILILSSGSKKVYRDTAILLTYKDRYYIRRQNIRPLYEMIRSKAEMKDEEINIEGLAVSNEKVYLFQRGNISGNFIAGISRKEFLNYVNSGEMEISDLNIYPFDLPEKDKVKSGFSGACMIPGQDSILFTASMENTQTVTGDGEIIGSYIGIIPLKDLPSGKYTAQLLTWGNKSVVKKIEGICVRKKTGNEMDVITVSDNDNGTSDLYRIKLKI